MSYAQDTGPRASDTASQSEAASRYQREAGRGDIRGGLLKGGHQRGI